MYNTYKSILDKYVFKSILILGAFLLTIQIANAQTFVKVGSFTNETLIDGVYIFEKADLTIRNYTTQEIVEHKSITDTSSVDFTDIHLEFIFLNAELNEGGLQQCIMSDRQRYKLNEEMKLEPISDKFEKSQPTTEDITNHYRFAQKVLPPYSMQLKGEELIVSFAKYNFGQSNIDYTMQAELIVTMTKQKDR